ncbi:MAG: FG-GAP-like repeat-containing protein [Planctomycetaceae bacterium]
MILIVAGLLLVSSLIGVWLWRTESSPTESFDNLLSEAQIQLAAREYQSAENLANRALQIRPDAPPALMIAAEAATRLNRLDEALEYYSRIPEQGVSESVSALYGSGEILIHQGKISKGEARLRRVLEVEPGHQLANYRLAFVLGITGRSWEAVPYSLQLIRKNVFSEAHLLMLGDMERVVKTGGVLKNYQQTVPDDPLPKLGLARIALADNRLDEAEKLLRNVLSHRPGEVEAQARLGEVLLLRGKFGEFSKWHAQLPEKASSHPIIWTVRGLWFRERKENRAAIRCFLEAVSIEPNYRRANYQLGQLLQAAGNAKLANPFLKRADQLQKLSLILDGFYRNWAQRRVNPDVLARIVRINESLGRIWEAWGWTQFTLKIAPQTRWAIAAAGRIKTRLRADLPRTLPSKNPARLLNLDAYPLPDLPQKPVVGLGGRKQRNVTSTRRVQFRDYAQRAGIHFRYFNSADKKTPGARIFETTGGGVAALDYDGDGWPDLYFTQGAHRPPLTERSNLIDRLYRNSGNGTFEDITISAGLGDADFSQGVTFGDFDNDGFPDLYVANLGRNRLYRNNGDGTFTDISETAGIQSATWTSSCLMADVNGDGLPDLYDVNYIADKNLSLICKRDGKPMSCSPLAYHAAQDRLLLNRGDGRFEDVTNKAGIQANDGYGLGILAADFEGKGRLSLFVANDQTANFFFRNRSTPSEPLRFVESGLLTGLAADSDGKSQGCMGVAAGDADGDGRLDLFVTNFFNESNALYLSMPGGQFVESSRPAGLRTASFSKLGFGTQFLDADLDGLSDLVVANGHIDDLSDLNEPYAMQPQYFANRGGGRFEEITDATLGDYFRGKWLGRGLARIDWNRDGREDFAVSHLEKNCALVTNETQSAGHFLAIKLRGVFTSRDAIGTQVSIRQGARTWSRQLVAGDGYQACNQRQLIFGLGNMTGSAQIEVKWSNGKRTSYENVPLNREVLIIEGYRKLILLPRVNPSK